jgi:pyruvate formate lyase activating enzyme
MADTLHTPDVTTGVVFDIRRYAIHDGPGIRTTVFLKGCALTCAWCHNPESQAVGYEAMLRESRCIRCGACVDACGHGAISWTDAGPLTDRARCAACGDCTAVCYAEARERVGREMTVDAVLAEVARDAPFYAESGGGLTLSGGEPLLQREFTTALLRGAKAQGYHTALDTCGFAPWEAFERLRGFVDVFLYDLKLMDDTRHRRFTGVTNAPVLENLRALSARGHRIVLRVPVVPGITDDAENLRALAAFAAELPHLAGVDLLPYHPIGTAKYDRLDRPYALADTTAPSAQRMAEIARILAGHGLRVSAGY